MEDDQEGIVPRIIDEDGEEANAQEDEEEGGLEEAMKDLVEALRQRLPLAAIRGIVETRVGPHQSPDLFLIRKDREEGWTPLHHAVLYRCQLCVIEYLVEVGPGAVRTTTNAGSLPLHFAAANAKAAARPHSSKVVRVLVEAWSGALMERSATGWLPLHLALATGDTSVEGADRRRRRTDVDAVKVMVQMAPQALREPGRFGMLPIHCLVQSGMARAGLKTTKLVVDAYPEALMVRDDHGNLPVHLANAGGPLRYLVTKCPQSAVAPAREAHNGTLLHLALTKWRWDFVNEIQHVVQHCPGIVTMADAQGDRALHLAARQFHSEVAELLVEQSPDSVRAPGHRGRLPVHGVADPSFDGHRAARVPMLRFLHESWQESLLEGDDDGKTPLHLAAGGRPIRTGEGGTLDVVLWLADAGPDALVVQDNEGRLPLHDALDLLANVQGVSAEELQEVNAVVEFLMEERPESIHVPDREGNRPRDVARSRGVNVPQAALRRLF